MPVINIVNIRGGHDSDAVTHFYCDRRSPVGNPFAMSHKQSRDDVCDQYEEYFHERMIGTSIRDHEFQEYVYDIQRAYVDGDVSLLCWCAPLRCHTQTIKNYILEEAK